MGLESSNRFSAAVARAFGKRLLPLVLCGVTGVTACGRSGESIDSRCALPAPQVVRENGAAVLLEWRLQDQDVFHQPALPNDSAFLAYRAAVRADGADLRDPVADDPEPGNAEEAALWEDEDYNHELARSGAVGSIRPITCLDALLFAHQNARVPELTTPTEFVASVLRRQTPDPAGGPRTELAVIFGAGNEMFVPKEVYGFDRASALVAEGWEYVYVLHNHTLQTNGDRIALGRPTLSVSDVHLTRNLVANRGLESARVTNGFYTFTVPAGQLPLMRSR